MKKRQKAKRFFSLEESIPQFSFLWMRAMTRRRVSLSPGMGAARRLLPNRKLHTVCQIKVQENGGIAVKLAKGILAGVITLALSGFFLVIALILRVKMKREER